MWAKRPPLMWVFQNYSVIVWNLRGNTHTALNQTARSAGVQCCQTKHCPKCRIGKKKKKEQHREGRRPSRGRLIQKGTDALSKSIMSWALNTHLALPLWEGVISITIQTLSKFIKAWAKHFNPYAMGHFWDSFDGTHLIQYSYGGFMRVNTWH